MKQQKITQQMSQVSVLAVLAIMSQQAFADGTNASISDTASETTAVSATDTTAQLKDSSKGFGRFRGGFYMAAGYQGAASSDVSPKIQGLVLEAGGYLLANPIKKFADIEVGANIKYNPGMSMKSANTSTVKYYNGLTQITAYAGPVFQFGGGKHAIGAGLSKAFYLREEKGDSKDKTARNKLSNGLGAYIEYQWVGPKQGTRHVIPFARFTVERFDLKSASTGLTSKQTVYGLVGGIKY